MKTAIMKKLFLSFAAVITGLFLSICAANAESGSTGKEFYFSFQPNYSGNGTLSLFITGQQDTQGTVGVAGLNFSAPFTVKANKVTTVAIPKAAQNLPANAISKLAVHVVTQGDVTVYGLNLQSYTTDAFLALPVDALGLEYHALSYVNNVGYPSQVVIVGAFDNTQVTITPSAQLNSHAAGVPFTIVLNRGDTYMLTSTADVSGTNIVASAPIAVMSGVECVNVPTGAYACDHIVEMMPPVSTWGKSFLTVPLATRRNGDVFRILASQDGTKVNINGTLVATIQRGKFFETVIKSRSEIETSAPVLVAQYSPGSSFDGVTSDPFMMVIPPTEQFLNQYTFSTPASGFSANFVNVVVPSGEIGSLQLDGAPVDVSKFSAIGSSGFSGAQLPISLGSHNLASTSNVPFGIYVYGYASYDSYGYPGGMSFKAINPVGDPYPPNLRLIQVGDTIQGSASDSEDTNANGILDAGEDINGNGKIDRRSEDLNGNGKLDPGEDANGNNILDRDTGILKVELLAGSDNLKLDVLPFIPGTLATQFSLSRIDLTKPGLGVLHIEDGAGNKVEAPISIGAVASLQNVRVIETLSTSGIELDLASFAKQPFSITDGVNQKIIEWRFDTFRADSTADLGFEIVLKNPVPGESRLVSHKLGLYYDDVNGNPVHTELGSRFVDVYPSIYQVTPVTDKASYGANEVVLITSAIKNLSAYAGAAALRLSIVDAGNVPVAALGILPAQTVAAGATGVFTGLNFPTGSSYVGKYKVLAELVDNGGNVITSGSAPFVIAAAGGPSVKAVITTDKQRYNPFETVRISDRVANLLANATLDDLRVITTVMNPDGSVRFSKTETLAQLSPNALKDYAYDMPLASAAAGQYSATLMVTRADGTQLAQAGTQFTVASSAETGAGLSGTITATPTLASFGQTVNLTFGASNNGNSELVNLPLKVSIVDPEKQQLVAEYPYSTTLAIGGSYNGSTGWVSSGDSGATYVALLGATIGGRTITLAQTTFTVLKLDIKQTLSNDSRVLVLLTCKEGEAQKTERASNLKPKSGDGQESSGKESPDQEHDDPCNEGRAQILDTTLTALGIEHLVTVTVEDFRAAFRGGKYNVYWISGGAEKLKDRLAEEIREAVNRGDGLLLDGVHDERNKALDEVAGVLYRGKLAPADQPITLTGPLFAPGTLATLGRPLKLALGSGAQQATFPAGLKCDDCEDKGEKNGTAPGDTPAIVSNAYGRGHGLIMAYDLVGTLTQTQPIGPLWEDIMQTALGYLTPQTPDPFTAGAYAVARTRIANQGPAVALEITDILPSGAAVVTTVPQAIVAPDNTQAKWNLSLATGQGADLSLALRVPDASGSHTLTTTVNSTWNGQGMLYGSYPLTLNVASALDSTATARLIADLKALSFNAGKDREARDQAVKALQDALARTAQGDYDTAIDKLLDAIDKLSRITAKDMSAYRLGVDRWLQELELEWLLAQTHH